MAEMPSESFTAGDRVQLVRCGCHNGACRHVGLYGKVGSRSRFTVDVLGPVDQIRALLAEADVSDALPLTLWVEPSDVVHID